LPAVRGEGQGRLKCPVRLRHQLAVGRPDGRGPRPGVELHLHPPQAPVGEVGVLLPAGGGHDAPRFASRLSRRRIARTWNASITASTAANSPTPRSSWSRLTPRASSVSSFGGGA